MEEIWKDIIWYEWLYQISNHWNIKSLERFTKNWTSWYLKKEKKLKPWSKKYNYQCIYLCKDWKRNINSVHRLVAQAFLWLDIKINSIEIWHKDNNPKNNNIDNLYLTNHKDNEVYKKLCKRTAFWEKNWKSKLTEKQVLEIYKLYKEWKKKSEISRIYNLKDAWKIIRWQSWKYLYINYF